MKISPSAFPIVAALLTVGSASAFVPNSCQIGNGPAPASTTACFSSDVDTEASTSSPNFPFSDRQVRFAYDEWRLIYGKGDYDPVRFKNFKTNHKTLVISNLKAREKAEQDGRPPPQWMSLNEYGDYSIEEYEAMLRGEQVAAGEKVVASADESMTYSSSADSGLEPGETLVTKVRGTQPIHESEYQDAFGRTIRSTQALNQDISLESAAMNVDANYANNIDDSRGTLIIPNPENVNGQSRGTQAIGTGSGTQKVGSGFLAARGTQPVSTGTPRGTQAISSGSPRGTQVVSTGAGSQRGTQVVSTGVGASRGTQSIRGTVPVNRGGSPGGTQSIRGTQPIGGSPVRGTQPISSDGGGRGTQVVQSTSGGFGTQSVGSGRGTQVVGSGDTSYGTQPIQSSPDEEEIDYDPNMGTQIIPKNEEGTQIVAKGDTGGTQVVSPAESVGGTQVFEKKNEEKKENEEDGLSKFFGILFGDSEKKEEKTEEPEEPEAIGKRGTMVIKRSIKAPEQKKPKSIFSILFDSDSEEKEDEKAEEEPKPEEPKSTNFFDFLNSKDETKESETPAKASDIEEENKPEGGIFSLFGGNVQSSNPRPVRTSISLQKQAPKKSTVALQSRRQTKLIPDDAEKETGMPSILSFFGGAKKVDEEETVRNPKARPTLVVKKPKTVQSQFSSLFSSMKTEETLPETTAKKGSAAITSNKNPIIAARLERQKQAAERAAARKEEAQKRLAKTKAKVATKPVTEKARPASSPFSFFGAIGKQSDPPTLKNWRQNRDGSLTGLIYDSKSFKDGTRITTSPVPRGAKKGTTVKTGGGSEYNLM